jgi:hypothetical protein
MYTPDISLLFLKFAQSYSTICQKRHEEGRSEVTG